MHTAVLSKYRPERRFGRPSFLWRGGGGMALKELRREGVNWLHLVQVLVNSVINFRVP
jgi:hypothetical protein